MSRPPDPSLDPIEALVQIRTLVEATADLTMGPGLSRRSER
jgi:hypothetical protein